MLQPLDPPEASTPVPNQHPEQERAGPLPALRVPPPVIFIPVCAHPAPVCSENAISEGSEDGGLVWRRSPNRRIIGFGETISQAAGTSHLRLPPRTVATPIDLPSPSASSVSSAVCALCRAGTIIPRRPHGSVQSPGATRDMHTPRSGTSIPHPSRTRRRRLLSRTLPSSCTSRRKGRRRPTAERGCSSSRRCREAPSATR
jgi:hypothetical protein